MAQQDHAANEAQTWTLGSFDTERAARYLEALGRDRVIELYTQLLRIRRFEEQAGRAYQMGKIKGFCHLYIGQEAVAVGSMGVLEERDYVVAAYREHGQALARGLDAEATMAELFGKATGVSGGKGGSMHLFDTSKNFYGGWGIVGGQIPTAAGLAFASKYRDEGAVCLCFFGEGSIHQGAFHETLNMAALWDLPVVFITENNKYAMGTVIDRASAIVDIQQKALGYGMAHDQLNGQDIFAVMEGVGEAVRLAREESKPTFLDIRTYRYRGHSMSDPASYRTKDEVTDEQQLDPIQSLHNWLVEAGVATDEELGQIDRAAKDEMKAAIKAADAAPFPPDSALYEDIYVEWPFPIE